MNAWIDMDNSPHVHLLIPFVTKLEERNYRTYITARNYAQTIELLINNGHPYTEIGKHSGAANKIKKVFNLLARVYRLVLFAKRKNFAIAVNHGSRAQALACKILRIPCFIGMDYEHTESRIFAFCATRIWMPDILYPAALPFIGISERKALTYAGIKEQFYLNDFEPDPMFKDKLGIPKNKILVVLRPPADLANYHNHKSESLLEQILSRLKERNDVYTICTPRTPKQKVRFKQIESASFKVIDWAIDGKNLAYYADMMISGGGTMNREAAFFGADVYSIFSGPKPMVDVELQRLGLLNFIESSADCLAINFKQKTANKMSSNFSQAPIEGLVDKFVRLTTK